MNTYTVIDIETTGLNSNPLKSPVDEIIKISCVKIVNHVIVDVFDSFVKSKKKMSKAITNITGISNKNVKNAPQIKDVLCKLKEFIGDSILVSHNIGFDLGFISYYGDKYQIKFENKIIDTFDIVKDKMANELKDFALHTIADYFEIEKLPDNCMTDAFITGLIFLKMKERYGKDIEKFIK